MNGQNSAGGAAGTSFPYVPRTGQIRMMHGVFDALTTGRHLIMESPTGSGKTASVLSAAVDSMGTRKILYLTRTNSQQRQVMRELRMIKQRRNVLGIAIQGRNNGCLLARQDDEMRSGSADELSAYCGYLKERTKSEHEGCPYYYGLLNADRQHLSKWLREEMPDAEQVTERCMAMQMCPYEMSKSFLADADVVTAPYIYFFDPFIRRRLLEWMGTQTGQLIIILDEAHNLPDYLREIESVKFGVRSAQGMRNEAEEYGDPEIISGVSIRDLSEIVETAIRAISADYVLDEDGLVPPEEFEMRLMEELGVNSRSFSAIAAALSNQGDLVRDAKLKKGRLPRSYIRSMGDFIRFWTEAEPGHHVKVVNGGDNPSLEVYCLDPAIAAAPLQDAYVTIHMSGTLGSLPDYRTLLQLPEDSILLSVPSDFPAENRKIVYVDDMTTRYEVIARDAGMIAAIADRIVDVCNSVHRNTIVFVPSYGLLDSLLALNIERRMDTQTLVERKDMKQIELMECVERFKSVRGSVFFSVIGGRIGEGLDFPDESLEMVIIVGIPYPKPTAKQRALVNYYDILYGKGWDIAVKGPALRKLLQAAGRMIRSDTDRGIAVVLDKRLSYFTVTGAEKVDDAPGAAADFFSGKRNVGPRNGRLF
ncbi:MAG: ATP-dependent DNA helicase [Methanomassiliicoccales archaeon]|nr:ATP-dependent DNA helicase [Methanomassiliicoccales archaeon]